MKKIKIERMAQFKSFLSGSEGLFFQRFFPELLKTTAPVVTDIEVTDISNFTTFLKKISKQKYKINKKNATK